MTEKVDELLARAKEHCFFLGLEDSGALLCKSNSVYSIAAIHYLQERIGIRPDATFITTPDMTITRNTERWRSGFGYGGKITWGNGSDEFIVLNSKPNACGMLVGGLEKLPDAGQLLNRVHSMEAEETWLNGIRVEWDFYKSNHFIDIFQVKPVAEQENNLSPYAFIIHGSACELNRDNPLGFGLYFDKSPLLAQMAEQMETPFGCFTFLTGRAAQRYLQRYAEVEEFARQKRLLAARKLFGDFTLISNHTHQGLINLNEIILGCNHVKDYGQLFPVALRDDLPAFLVRGRASMSPSVIESAGFEKRARELGVYDRLLNANIFPHGGGYTLPGVLEVNRVLNIHNNRYFEIEMLNDRGKMIVSELKEIPFEYRGRPVVQRSKELGLFDIAAKLIPRFVLKI